MKIVNFIIFIQLSIKALNNYKFGYVYLKRLTFVSKTNHSEHIHGANIT